MAADYGGGPPADAAYTLLPALVSTYGAWHPAFVDWVRRLLRDQAAASSRDDMEANGLLGGMIWRVAALLSLGAQRAIFHGLARCIPALQVGDGQLGRALSEEPEFWRAAPDADCVDWVASELGLLPESWDLAGPAPPTTESTAGRPAPSFVPAVAPRSGWHGGASGGTSRGPHQGERSGGSQGIGAGKARGEQESRELHPGVGVGRSGPAQDSRGAAALHALTLMGYGRGR